ncbi:phosphate-selective porin OprO and OprP [Dyella sp. OK004]|uniref:OprO/OprP family phosphate-selective porin n=1 Tax=Dyella sp. OK004 TaxID=1855292 RepID=UPI0008E846B8|nr:porin [Dyella sp. OK004]SFS14140.1 phosphate-selective porin OprO and OprP [Dyella sp. OK004]
MKKPLVAMSLTLALPILANAADTASPSYNFRDNWPTHYVFSDGTDLGLAVKYQDDLDNFSNDDGRLKDSSTNRRKEFGAYIKKKDVYDATVVYDFQAKTWLDVFFRLQTKALFGNDLGAVRVGQSKLPVGFEGNTGTGSTTFLETALPMQAVYAGRRIGVDWQWLRPAYLINAGYYQRDLQGDNHGHTVAARAAWTPLNKPGDVVHLGVSASRETPDGSTDGRGIHTPPSARLRSRPEAGLTTVRLIDSGNLPFTDYIDRRGFESLWIHGPWSLQGEYLDAKVKFFNGKPAYHGEGFYAFGSWVVTGESRGYAGGNVSDVKPKGALGALELAIRYSQLDLNDGAVLGGKQHDWTFGANWYINRYLKLQANYILAKSKKRNVSVDPDVFEVRAQVMF